MTPDRANLPAVIVHRAKVPLDYRTGHNGAVTDPAIRLGFVDACRLAHRLQADGLGFVLGDGWCGVDLDHVRDPITGAVSDWAVTIAETIETYTEESISGAGLHLIARGTLPPGRRRHGCGIEMYDQARHFCTTGTRFDGAPLAVPDRTDRLAALHRALFPAVAAPTLRTRPSAIPLDDAAVIDRCRRAANAAKFARLWAGDASAYPSGSEADQALCNLLAWFATDGEQVERLMAVSGLGAREKWQRRPDYRQRTIRNALVHVGATRLGTQHEHRS